MAPLSLSITASSIVFLALAACHAQEEPSLDVAGKMMLDPKRERAIEPEETVRRLAIPLDATVADIGAGPGFLTLYLARAVPRGRVIATDVDENYLAVAKRRAEEARLTNVITRRVEADHPGLEPASIDLAVLCQVDHFLKDRAQYFNELSAALRPSGRIVIINFNRNIEAAKEAAARSSLEVIETWTPSVAFTAIVLAPRYKKTE